MTNDTKDIAVPKTQKPNAQLTQSEIKKKRLAEQLRQNLKNRKAQARQRRSFDKNIEE